MNLSNERNGDALLKAIVQIVVQNDDNGRYDTLETLLMDFYSFVVYRERKNIDRKALDGDILLAKHQLQYHTGRTVWLPGQYKGLAERKGIAAPLPAAHQQELRVEVRSLSFYDALLGGTAHG